MKRPRWSALPPRATAAIELFTAAVTAGVVIVGGFHHFFDSGSGQRAYPGEGRRIVAFRQLANRICVENNDNMRRAVRKAQSRPQLLSYVHRASGWDVRDLTAITPPPKMISDFLEEVALRRHIGADFTQLEKARGAGNGDAEAHVGADIRKTEAESAELSATLALPRCTHILPPLSRILTR